MTALNPTIIKLVNYFMEMLIKCKQFTDGKIVLYFIRFHIYSENHSQTYLNILNEKKDFFLKNIR